MARLDIRFLSVIFTGCALLGCAGAEQPPAETPIAPTEPARSGGEAVDPPETDSAVSVDAEPEPTEQPEAEPEPEEEVFEPERPPQEFLTDKQLSFETNFKASEVGEKTDARCEQENGGDMRAYAACKKKVSDKVGVRVLRFVEKGGTWWLRVYSKKDLGKTFQLNLLHKVRCKFGDGTDNSITIELQGKDEMKTLPKLPRKFVVTVPNNYSIDIADREHGRMNYTAKYGNFPDQKK